MNLNRKTRLSATASAIAMAAILGIGTAAAGEAVPAIEDEAPAVADIVRAPTDLPPPITYREPQRHLVELEGGELVGQRDDGTTYRYWTFNGQVPGPFIRVRVGDTVEVRFTNHEDSWLTHNVDFHAVTGLHGGGHATLAEPGTAAPGFTFKAINPGLYVYHCATPTVAQHIANGMYGMILVEPEEGLPEVDREFYVMQGELYTEEPFGTAGELTESYDKLLDETPEYYVFNGAVGALTEQKPLTAEVGETVRVFFGVGGPNATSSFHVIGHATLAEPGTAAPRRSR
jgi:nitrite reductase (NO-forming)